MQIFAIIRPNSKHREGVVNNGDGKLVIYIKAQAVEGKANIVASELIAEHFSTSKTKVRLIRGHRSKHKVFEVDA